MIVAMFLTKIFISIGGKGEQYFMQKLVHGDIAANNGGWQWCAGTGADAAPISGFKIPAATKPKATIQPANTSKRGFQS